MIIQNKTDFKALIYEVITMIEEGELIEGQKIEYPFDFLGISINDDHTVDIYRRASKEVDGYAYTEANQPSETDQRASREDTADLNSIP